MVDKRGVLALSQIFILITSIFAFCFLISLSEMKVVSGENEPLASSDSKPAIPIGGNKNPKSVELLPQDKPSSAATPIDAAKILKPSTSTFKGGYKLGETEYTKFESTADGIKGYVKDDTVGKVLSEPDLDKLAENGLYDKATGKLISPTTGSDAGDWLLGNGWVSSLGTANFVGHIVSGLEWSMIVAGGIKFLGGFVDDKGQVTNALTAASFGGIMAGKTTYGLIKQGGWLSGSEYTKWVDKVPGGASGTSIGIGVIVAAIIFYNSYKSSSTEIVSFTCNPWDAPTGGARCEECNQGTLPCSEYQCRSLGQSCELVNPGTTEEKCVWVNKNDVKFPTITPREDALTSGYKYSPDNTISPPDRGVKIIKSSSTSGCVKAFEPLSFGITTDKPAKCKVDYLKKNTFDEMDYYFGGSSTLKYNHTQVMALPGANSTENGSVILQNNGNYELFVRCQDANGNYNTGNFVFKYCVEKGPDTTAPLIVTTNLINGMPIAHNQTEINLEVYINEPAECKWSHLDQDFKDMTDTMSCSSSILEMNAQMLYKCATKLTGLKNNQENKFYFRCKDQPGKAENERNTNSESYEFKLIGTQPLSILSVGPNGTARDSSESIKVTLTAKTAAGYNEGKAICYYSSDGSDDSYVMFFDTDSYTHSQDLYLDSGNYEYWIKCVDLGGNSAVNATKFTAESDTSSPLVVRTYHEESYLKFTTNEEAECVYDTVDCNYLFADGKKISTVDDTEHFIDWNTKTNIYIKCADKFGNQPAPSECSMIIRAYGAN